jgi:hypothetical protein
MPDFSDDAPNFFVWCDASDFALGAVLLQGGQVIAYSTGEKELLGIVHALGVWQSYLEGGKGVRVMTDHAPNTYLPSQPNLSRRQARWSGFLQRFNTLTWHYKPGRINVADPVSRSPPFDNASVADLAAAEWRSWLHCTSTHGDQHSVTVNAIQCALAGSPLCNLFATQIVTACEGTDSTDVPLASNLLDRIRAGYAADPQFGQLADKPDHRF